MEQGASFGKSVKEFFRFLIIAAAIALPIRYFVAQPFIVRGASMQPNFKDSEYLIVDELSYFFRPPERGEVIVFRFPLNPSEFFIKRVIGLPGDRVEISNGNITITPSGADKGFPLAEPYLPAADATSGNVNVLLGKDDYFVLGDNRPQSSDSRMWGVLPKHLIIGRALIRAWPVSDIGIVGWR